MPLVEPSTERLWVAFEYIAFGAVFNAAGQVLAIVPESKRERDGLSGAAIVLPHVYGGFFRRAKSKRACIRGARHADT